MTVEGPLDLLGPPCHSLSLHVLPCLPGLSGTRLSWSNLVPSGPFWSLLVPCGSSWSFLVPPGPCWSLLMPLGTSLPKMSFVLSSHRTYPNISITISFTAIKLSNNHQPLLIVSNIFFIWKNFKLLPDAKIFHSESFYWRVSVI